MTMPTRVADVRRVGCVSFLNAKPLIQGLENRADLVVRFDVPSRLLGDLEAGEVDMALCPVIDLQRSVQPLRIVPVGGIGCHGKTLTVRLFSRVPWSEVREVYADTDSHTSVALMRVLLAEMFDLTPQVVDYDARQHPTPTGLPTDPQTVLLIGDKVVTAEPPIEAYPHQLDLGEAWLEHTDLPFVFAVWMAQPNATLGELPQILTRTRLANAKQIDAIVARHAAAHGWPAELATQYLGHWLRYDIGPTQLQAIDLFCQKAFRLGIVPHHRPIELWQPPATAATPQQATGHAN